MPISLTTTPTYPLVSKGARITFTPTTGNAVRLWCVAAPLGSKLRKQIEESSSSRVEIYSGDATSTSEPFLFQPDVPGKYGVIAQEYTRGASSYGGGYAGDPKGFGSETKIGGEVSASIAFGQRMTMAMGVAPNTAQLVLHVWEDTIRETTFALHGERSPAIVNPTSGKAKTALVILDDGTLSASVRGLIGLTATTAVGDVSAIVTDMMTKFIAHFGHLASVHAAADSVDSPSTAFAFPGSPKAIQATVKELLYVLGLHLNTDATRGGTGVHGLGSGTWHNPSGSAVTADGVNALVAQAPSNEEQAYIGVADLWRAYEAHRANLAVHGVAETTYPLAGPAPALLALHIFFLQYVQSALPPTVATENPGAAVLANLAGMKPS